MKVAKTIRKQHTLYTVAFRLKFREHNRHARKLSGVNAVERIIGNYAEGERQMGIKRKIKGQSLDER